MAIERLGSYLLGNTVAVRQVSIGFTSIEITGLEVQETSLAGAPQLEIQTIYLAPTIWRGLRRGIWLRDLVVREPKLHLRFDCEGNLLSRFPQSGGGGAHESLRLPFSRASVANAVLVVHQEGKPALTIRGGSLTATVDQFVHVRAEVTDLLGAQLRLESRVDASTFGGRSTFLLTPLHLGTKQLARLPMVPIGLADHPIRGTVEARAQIDHPAGELDPRKHGIAFLARVTNVVAEPGGLITKGIDLRASQHDGNCTLAVEGPLADGTLRLNAHSDLTAQDPEFTATLKLADVELEPIARTLGLEIPIAATAFAEGTAFASWKQQVLTFRASLTPSLTNIHVDGIPVGDVTTDIACDGSLDRARKQPIAGSLSINTESQGVELGAVSGRFGRGVAKGTIGFQASGNIPLAGLSDLRTYRAHVAIQSSPLVGEGMTVGPLTVDARLQDGNIDVSLAEAMFAVAKAPDRSSDCLVNQLQLADSLQVRTQFETSVPISRLVDPDAWTASVFVDVRGLAIAREPIGDFTTGGRLASGELKISPCSIRWRDNQCGIEGNGNLHNDTRATVRFTAGPVSLQDVADVASRFSKRPLPISGAANASGEINLVLRPFTFSAGGELILTDARYAQTRVGNTQLRWDANPKTATLRSVSNDFLGGSYVVDASLPSLDWTKTTVVASCQNIELRRLAGVVGNQLHASGFIDGSLRLDSIGELETLRADGWLKTRDASLAGAPFELQTTELRVGEGSATAAIRGAAFGGTLSGNGGTKLVDLSAWLQHQPRDVQQLPVFGRLQAKGLAVKRILAPLDRKRSLAPLNGKLSMICVRDQASARKGLLATFDCSAENLRWNQAVMSQRLRATGVLRDTRVEVSNIDGRFADGKLSGDVDLRLAGVPSGTFHLNAQRINLRRALAPIPSLSRSVTGAASVSVSGRLGSLSTGAARIHASNIDVGGLSIRELRFPVECSFQSRSSQVKWQCRGGTLNVGGGSVSISSDGTLANGLATMATSVDIRSVDSAQLMRDKSISVGIIQGNVNIQSNRARRPEDLTGRFHLELSQLQSMEVPGFESFTQLVKLPRIEGPTVNQSDGGTIDGRLGGGLLYVDSVALSKGGLLVLMDGTSTLNGRLDFDVTAFTNQSGPADGLLSLADSPLMLAAPAPVALLIKANEAMKDRVIHIHVGGTGTRPTLRLQPAKTLSQDALRFFVRGSLGSRAADVAIRQQRQPIR